MNGKTLKKPRTGNSEPTKNRNPASGARVCRRISHEGNQENNHAQREEALPPDVELKFHRG